MVDTHVRIDEKLKHKAKIAAAKEDIPLKEWLDRAVRNALKQKGK